MGFFSYMCKECGESIKNNGPDGEPVRLVLLEAGRPVEEMIGRYDGYGRVFGYTEWLYKDWHDLVNMHFSNDKHEGFAAVHLACDKGNNFNTVSEDDPDQGYGRASDFKLAPYQMDHIIHKESEIID